MAKQRVFAAFDGKLKVFLTPFTYLHLGQATRAWEEICNDPQSLMGKHPADFSLYEIGNFDDDTGLVTPHSPLQLVATALEVKRKPQEKLPLTALNQ